MQNTFRFVIADDEEIVLKTLRRYLGNLGHTILAEASSGQELVDAVIRTSPDLVITDIKLTGWDGLRAIEAFSRQYPTPVIVISGSDDQSTFDRASACPIQAYLPKPFKESGLAAAITIALKRFSESQALRVEVDNTRRRLADRAVVERAKAMLMKGGQVDEEAAYQKIRGMARNSGHTAGQVARSLLLAGEVMSEIGSTRSLART